MASLEMLYRLVARDGASPAFRSVGESAKLLQRTVEEANAKIAASQRALADQTTAAMTRIERAEAKAAAASEKHAKARRESLMKVGATSALILTAVAAESIKMAANFQQSTNVLVTAAGESTGALKGVRAGILSIASETGTKWQDLVDGMYRIEKAGFRGADGLHILKAAAQGAREEGASLEVVTGSLTSALLDYHLPASAAVMVTNEMKTAAGEAKATFEEFDKGLGRILPMASSLHISLADVSGSLAEMTQHGLTAQDASDQLQNAMRNLAKANGPAQKMMAQLGIDSMDVATKLGDGPGGRGLAGTMQYLSSVVLKNMGPAGTVLLSTMNQSKIAARDADVMFNALPDAARKVAQAYKDGTLTYKEFRKSTGGLSASQAALARQWATTENNAKGYQQTLKNGLSQNQTYNAMMQTMTGGANGLSVALNLTGANAADTNERIHRVADAAAGAGKNVSGWESTQTLFNVQLDRFKQSIDGLMIALGTTLLPAVTAVFGFLANHTEAVRILAEVIGGVLVAATIAWGIALFSTGVGEVVLAITALGVGLIELITHFRQVTDFLKNVWAIELYAATKFVERMWHDVSGFFSRMWHDVTGFAERIWHDVSGFFSRMWHDVTGFADRLVKDVDGFFNRMANDVMGPLRAIASFVHKHWRLLLTIATLGVGLIYIVIQDHWKAISGVFAEGWHAVTGFVSRMWHDVSGFFSSLWHDVTGWVSRLWDDVFGKTKTQTAQVTSTVSTHVTKVTGWFSSLWNDVTGWVSRLWHDVSGFFSRIAADVWAIISPFIDRLVRGWTRIYDNTMGVVRPLWHDVVDIFGKLEAGVIDVFDRLSRGIGRIWGTIKELVAAPIRWVIENPYDKGILPLIHGLGGILHESSMSNLAPLHFATGGVVPGSHSRDTVPIYATPGEVVVPKAAVAAAGGASSLMRALGFGGGGGAGGHYGNGGIVGEIGSAIGSAAGAVGGFLAHPLDGLKHLVSGALGAVAGPIIHGLEGLADKTLGGMGGMGIDMAHLVHVIGDKILSFVSGKDSATKAASAGGGKYTGGMPTGGMVTRWAPLVSAVLAELGLSGGLVGRVLTQIQTESGGDPNATQGNIGDVNNATGDLARGLLQVIKATFDTYAGPYASLGQYDPHASVYAGLNYDSHKFGGNPGLSDLGQGHGYATGGMPPIGVPYTVGENGPETRIDFRAGRILSHADSMAAIGGRSGPLVHIEHVDSAVDLGVWARHAAFMESAGHFG